MGNAFLDKEKCIVFVARGNLFLSKGKCVVFLGGGRGGISWLMYC